LNPIFQKREGCGSRPFGALHGCHASGSAKPVYVTDFWLAAGAYFGRPIKERRFLFMFGPQQEIRHE